jgi:hypothetical protein
LVSNSFIAAVAVLSAALLSLTIGMADGTAALGSCRPTVAP